MMECPYLGENIGTAEGLLEVPLFECLLAVAYFQGQAGDGINQPIKKYCRVDTSVSKQAECLENNYVEANH